MTNAAPIILALATFVTAFTGGLVLVINALRTKRIEEKVDAGAVVQAQIHTAVNSNMAAAVAKIDEGTRRFDAATAEISALKAAATTEIAAQMAELTRKLEERDRQNGISSHRERNTRRGDR